MRAAFLVATALLPRLAGGEPLIVAVEDAAEPFSAADGTGYANDVVTAAFRAAGVEIRLEVVPYARCKKMAMEGERAACVSMSWLNEFAGWLVFSERPIWAVHVEVFQSVARPLRSPDAAGLVPGTIVGVVNGYEYPDLVQTLARRGVVLDEAPSDAVNIRKLAEGRIDAAIVMANGLQPRDAKIVAAGESARVRHAFALGVEEAFAGFSLRHPRGPWAYVRFCEGFRRLQQGGELEAIRGKWFPQPAPASSESIKRSASSKSNGLPR